MPMILWRVVCAFEVMIESRSPTSAFISVDFPTLGLPMILTKPDLCMIAYLHQIYGKNLENRR